MPWWRGNSPVPIVACAHAVTVWNEPMNALRYTIDFDIRRLRLGHPFAQWVYTFHPPPSMTNVTITLGGVAGAGTPGSGAPSRGWKSPKPSNAAVVGARSASVTSS